MTVHLKVIATSSKMGGDVVKDVSLFSLNLFTLYIIYIIFEFTILSKSYIYKLFRIKYSWQSNAF